MAYKHKPCKKGSRRHPKTKRCRKISSRSRTRSRTRSRSRSRSRKYSRKPCKKGSKRHPKTKRCRKVSSRSRRRRRSRVGRPRDHNKYKASRGCSRQTIKKYSERPSPPYPANLCRNSIKKGNDGNKYKSSRFNRQGKAYYRWVKA